MNGHYNNFNYSLDLQSLKSKELGLSEAQKGTNILQPPPPKGASEREKNKYRYSVIEHVIRKHSKKGIPYYQLLRLRNILIKHIQVIPIWEYDIGTFNDNGKLTDSDMLKIDMKEFGKTNYQKNYVFMKDPAIQSEISRLIKNWIISGVAKPCDPHELSYISPLLLVNKNKNNKGDKREYRLCIDLKQLNTDTKPFLYHIPNIMEELHRFRNKNSISKLDLRHAFHHIKVHPDSQQYTGFMHQGIYYKMIRMGFGFTNAVNVFQFCIDKTLYDIPEARAYIDDIYILTNNNHENLIKIDKTLARLARDGWRVRFDKCDFLQKEVTQLGRTVNSKGIKLYEKHLEKILNFPQPKTTKQLHTYVGLLNWFQSFLPNLHNYKNIFQPVITGKKKFEWTPKLSATFAESKQLLNTYKNKLIYHPSPHLRYCVDIDASDYGFGLVIYQIGKKGLYPIEYYSSLFTKAQRAWHSTTKELFCLVKGLKRFQKYYFMRNKAIFVFTDCNFVISALKNAKTQKNTKYLRWLNYLNELKLILIHKPGKQNVMADYLSRAYFGDNNINNPKKKLEILCNKIPNIFKREIINNKYDNQITPSMIPMQLTYTDNEFIAKYSSNNITKINCNINTNLQYNHIFTINMLKNYPIPNIYISDIIDDIKNHQKYIYIQYLKRQAHKTISDNSNNNNFINCTIIKGKNKGKNKNKKINDTKNDKKIKNKKTIKNKSIKNNKKCTKKQKEIKPQIKIIYIHTDINKLHKCAEKDIIPYEKHTENLHHASSIINPTELHLKHEKLPEIDAMDIISAQNKDEQITLCKQYINDTTKSVVLRMRIYRQINKFHKKHIENYRIFDDILYYIINPYACTPRIILPKSIINKTLKYYHNRVKNCHQGQGLFNITISSKFWFRHMPNIINTIVNECVVCNLVKKRQLKSSDMHPIKAKYFNYHIQCDFKGPFKTIYNNYKYSFTIVDIFTGYVMCIPTKSTTYFDIIPALINWFSIFGTPKIIGNDGGNGFNNKIYKLFLKRFKIINNQGSPYHHQSQGKVERIHREINKIIKLYSVINEKNFINTKFGKIDDWSIILKLFSLKHNTTLHAPIGFSPHELIFGFKTNDIDIFDKMNIHLQDIQLANNYYDYIKYISYYKLYIKLTTEAKQTEYRYKMIQNHKNNNTFYEFKINDFVMISNNDRFEKFSSNVKNNITNKPNYIILKLLPFNKAIIRNIITNEIITGINISRLIPYKHQPIIENEFGTDIPIENEMTLPNLEQYTIYQLEDKLKEYSSNINHYTHQSIPNLTGDEDLKSEVSDKSDSIYHPEDENPDYNPVQFIKDKIIEIDKKHIKNPYIYNPLENIHLNQILDKEFDSLTFKN